MRLESAALAAAAVTAAVLMSGPLAGRQRLEVAVPRVQTSTRRRIRVSRQVLERVVVIVVTSASGLLLRSAAAAVVVAIVAGVLVRRLQTAREARLAHLRREAVVELCGALTAELLAGRSPDSALALSGTTEPLSSLLTPALRAGALGGDVATALAAASRTPGAESLRWIAACWTVAGNSGAGLAEGLDRLASSLRRDQALRREVAAQVAGPRATARMLAVLPLVALLLAAGTGADPVEVLLHTPIGITCLAVGGALAMLGLSWSERMIRTVERSI